LPSLSELGNQDGQKPVQVLDDAEVSDIEDGGAGIGVDGRDQLGSYFR
jgi:hypothetical protein